MRRANYSECAQAKYVLLCLPGNEQVSQEEVPRAEDVRQERVVGLRKASP